MPLFGKFSCQSALQSRIKLARITFCNFTFFLLRGANRLSFPFAHYACSSPRKQRQFMAAAATPQLKGFSLSGRVTTRRQLTLTFTNRRYIIKSIIAARTIKYRDVRKNREVTWYRFGHNSTRCYTPDQQSNLAAVLDCKILSTSISRSSLCVGHIVFLKKRAEGHRFSFFSDCSITRCVFCLPF